MKDSAPRDERPIVADERDVVALNVTLCPVYQLTSGANKIVVRCCPKQFEILVIEAGLNILNWVPISDELFVVLKRVVATSGEDHDSGYIWSVESVECVGIGSLYTQSGRAGDRM